MIDATGLREGDLLSIAQALRLLPIAKSSFYSLIESGRLSHFRIPGASRGRGRVLVARADLEALLAGARVPARVGRVPDPDAIAAKVRGLGG